MSDRKKNKMPVSDFMFVQKWVEQLGDFCNGAFSKSERDHCCQKKRKGLMANYIYCGTVKV